MEESKQIYKDADEKLYRKGYYISNMVYDNTLYELTDVNGKTVIDYLSLSQLSQLADLL